MGFPVKLRLPSKLKEHWAKSYVKLIVILCGIEIFILLLAFRPTNLVELNATLFLILWSHASSWISLKWAFVISNKQKTPSTGFYGFLIPSNILLLFLDIDIFMSVGKGGMAQGGLIFIFIPFYAIFLGGCGFVTMKIAQVISGKITHRHR